MFKLTWPGSFTDPLERVHDIHTGAEKAKAETAVMATFSRDSSLQMQGEIAESPVWFLPSEVWESQVLWKLQSERDGLHPMVQPGAELHVALPEGMEVQTASIKHPVTGPGEREQTERGFSALFLFFPALKQHREYEDNAVTSTFSEK